MQQPSKRWQGKGNPPGLLNLQPSPLNRPPLNLPRGSRTADPRRLPPDQCCSPQRGTTRPPMGTLGSNRAEIDRPRSRAGPSLVRGGRPWPDMPRSPHKTRIIACRMALPSTRTTPVFRATRAIRGRTGHSRRGLAIPRREHLASPTPGRPATPRPLSERSPGPAAILRGHRNLAKLRRPCDRDIRRPITPTKPICGDAPLLSPPIA